MIDARVSCAGLSCLSTVCEVDRVAACAALTACTEFACVLLSRAARPLLGSEGSKMQLWHELDPGGVLPALRWVQQAHKLGSMCSMDDQVRL